MLIVVHMERTEPTLFRGEEELTFDEVEILIFEDVLVDL